MATILNLSPRMEQIVELCDTVKTIADIGCDHGYITAELILQQKADKVVATDISEKSLNKAVLLCDSMNINSFVSFREGNGFSVITKRDKVKQAVICGMGGREIISILEKRPSKLYNFVLQPQSDVPMLREYLVSNGFEFVVDKLIKENDKYYNVIKVKKAKRRTQYLPIELYFGVTNFRENYKLFYEYLTEKYEELKVFKDKYGDLNAKKEAEWSLTNEALKMFESPSQNEENGEELKEQETVQEELQQENKELVEDNKEVEE